MGLLPSSDWQWPIEDDSKLQSPAPFLTIGTRGSPLALAQAHLVQRLLAEAHGVSSNAIAIRTITTSGDRLTDRPLSEIGGKGLFSKEIEAALAAGEIDIAVHSSKDMASELPPGLVLAAFLEREDVRDAFVSLAVESIDELPQGARLGTSSIRRAAQMRRHRPDLQIVPFRGNVDTRLKKLADGVADATLLALAGLRRLGRDGEAKSLIDAEEFPPAPAQGAIGIEIRETDKRSARLIAPLDHAATHTALLAERAMLAELDGSCRTPIGALTTIAGDRLSLFGQILTPDGREAHEARAEGPLAEAAAIGKRLGRELADAAGPDFLIRMQS
jgi:hydroxymethylbilane synthase